MIDPFDAPPGYIAAPLTRAKMCTACALYPTPCSPHPCTEEARADESNVVFIRAPHIRIAKDRQSPGWMARRLGDRYNWACGDTPEAAHRAVLHKLGVRMSNLLILEDKL